MKEIVCVTTSPHKWEAFQSLCKGVFDLKYEQLKIKEIQGKPVDVALHKARKAWKKVQKPLIVDDSGFELEAYPGFPAGATKDVMKSIGLAGLLKFCESINNFRLKVYSYIIYQDEFNSKYVHYGETSGVLKEPSYSLIGLPERPELWFDYFIPDGSTKTYGQLYDDEELEEFYYRARSFKNFLKWQLEWHVEKK